MDELIIDREHASRATRTAATEGRSDRRFLWGPDDVLRWAFAMAAGAIVIGVAWYVCAGEVRLSEQIGPTDAAVAGLLLSGLGNATWLLRGRRAVGERRRALLPDPVAQVRRVRQANADLPAPTDPATSPHAPAVGLEVYLAGPGMERFHRATCAMAAGRSGWTTMTRQEHLAAGRKPCGVCQA